MQLKRFLLLSALRRHAYIVAKSGGGKSELLKLIVLRLKQRLLRWFWQSPIHSRNTVFVLDPHGDLALECAAQRIFASDSRISGLRGKASNLVFVSPNDGMNPFDLRGNKYTPRQLEVMAQFLTRAFASMLGKGHADLSINMKTVLFPLFHVLLVLSVKTPESPMTLFDLARFLDDSRNHGLVEFGAHEHQNSGQNLFFRHLFFDPHFRSTKFSLRTKLSSLLNSPTFVRLLCQRHSTWDIASLFGSGKTIIINASKSALGAEVTEIYGRTITALLQSTAFLKDGKSKHPNFYILDEAATFVSDDLKTILAELRKFGLHLVLVNQIVHQGGASQELHDTIMGNTGVKIIGNAGYRTKAIMARECEIPVEHFQDLKVGEFIVKTEGRKAVRVKLPTFWLKNKSSVPSSKITITTTPKELPQGQPRFRPRFGKPRPNWKCF